MPPPQFWISVLGNTIYIGTFLLQILRTACFWYLFSFRTHNSSIFIIFEVINVFYMLISWLISSVWGQNAGCPQEDKGNPKV